MNSTEIKETFHLKNSTRLRMLELKSLFFHCVIYVYLSHKLQFIIVTLLSERIKLHGEIAGATMRLARWEQTECDKIRRESFVNDNGAHGRMNLGWFRKFPWRNGTITDRGRWPLSNRGKKGMKEEVKCRSSCRCSRCILKKAF